MSLALFHPITAGWFARQFSQPTDAQSAGWQKIATGENALILAPTGSGKTLAAFLYGLDSLVRHAIEGRLEERVYIIYVSPLRALSADIERNLVAPLQGLEETAAQMGRLLPPIRTAVRTGDTSTADRARLLRKPPHILITTPESLYLLLTSKRGQTILRGAERVIIDEIHALYGNKRGAHLALSLERLDAQCGRKLQRIGLSATVQSPENVAQFLAGYDTVDDVTQPRLCHVVEPPGSRELELSVHIPQETLSAVASRTAWDDIYHTIRGLVETHHTTLIFVTSRRLSERVAHDLEPLLGEGMVAAHHGALSKQTRTRIESRLKEGTLKAVVATASLELGIDIGHVDLVCQIGSPRSLAVLRQRIGRSRHQVGGKPKGYLFALTRDELIESAASVRALRHGRMDEPVIREMPLDILAQQLVAHVASVDGIATHKDGAIAVTELFSLARGAAPYRELDGSHFQDVLHMASEGVATRRGRQGAYLHHDRIHAQVKARRGARLAALTSGGAIPDKADYRVVEDASETFVGTIDEDFAVESMVGDVFLLGTHPWRVRRVEQGQVRVEDASGMNSSIPFWLGEGLARTEELSREVGDLRQEIVNRSDDREALLAWLQAECSLSEAAAAQAVDYVVEGMQALGALPTQDEIIAERFFDESGGMQLIIHAPFGARINRAFGLGLRKKFCRNFDFELQAAATDDAVLLSLGPQHSFPLEAIFHFLSSSSARDAILQATLQAPLWETRWRHNATRSLAVLRFRNGRRTPPPLLRMQAQDLLAAVFPEQTGCQDNHGGGDIELPDHPLVEETVRDCMEEAMDVAGLERVLGEIESGQIHCTARDTIAPSPFSHAILAANPYSFLDDAPLEERRTRGINTARPGEIGRRGGDFTTLSPEAIRIVEEELAPEPRDADELHDLLYTIGLVRPTEAWQPFYQALEEHGRAATIELAHKKFWVAAEHSAAIALCYPQAPIAPVASIGQPTEPIEIEATVKWLVSGLLSLTGPRAEATIAAELGVTVDQVVVALAALENEGRVLQIPAGATPNGIAGGGVLWCERHILQRIHRKTVGRLRAEVESVTAANYLDFLLRWQHLAPGTQLEGPQGVLEVIEQLQGICLTPAVWEKEILPARIRNFRTEWLDQLCLNGSVLWAKAQEEPVVETKTRPRVGAIYFSLRENGGWLVDARTQSPLLYEQGAIQLSDGAKRAMYELGRHGATFFSDLARMVADQLRPEELHAALLELAQVGLATADSFSALNVSHEPVYSLASRARSFAHLSKTLGRWSLVRSLTELRRDRPEDRDEALFPWIRLYLRRYGVVLRPLVKREAGAPPWRELLRAFWRLEARGEIRGGRFVRGVSGEQFATPETAQALAALKRAEPLDPLELPASDPTNLSGVLIGTERIAARPGQKIVVENGQVRPKYSDVGFRNQVQASDDGM